MPVVVKKSTLYAAYMRKIYFFGGALLLVLASFAFFVWWTRCPGSCSEDRIGNAPQKLSVVTTLFPLYDFARAIGGEYTEVSLLLPPGVESHSFEPKPSDMVRIDQSDVFVYTGKVMEPWAEDMRKGIRKTVAVVDASAGTSLLAESEGTDGEHERGTDHRGADPHIWLDFDNAALMVSSLEKAFAEKDPSRADAYRINAEAYRNRLSDMDAKYRDGLASCSTKSIVYGGHYAFGYLTHRYGLEYVAAQGLAPDAEPSAKDIAALVDQITASDIRYLFYEELASPKIAETLSQETGAKMLLLNAAHNIGKDEYAKGATFLEIMEENLANLREGLGCK